MTHALPHEVMAPPRNASSYHPSPLRSDLFDDLDATFCSCSCGGIHGRVGPHGPADGAHRSVRDVPTEHCPAITGWSEVHQNT